MKIYVAAISIAAVMLIALCAAPQTLDTGANAPDENKSYPLVPVGQVPDCGLLINLISPQSNEALSGGFRVEWTLNNVGGRDFTNKNVEFTIYMSTDTTSADIRTIQRMYGDLFKEDITFLQQVPKGSYAIGVRGKGTDCYIPAVQVPVRVL
jgi:hypothetical protein